MGINAAINTIPKSYLNSKCFIVSVKCFNLQKLEIQTFLLQTIKNVSFFLLLLYKFGEYQNRDFLFTYKYCIGVLYCILFFRLFCQLNFYTIKDII